MKAKLNRVSGFPAHAFLAAALVVCAATSVRAGDPADGMAKVLDGYIT